MKATEVRIGNYVYDTKGEINKINLAAIEYLLRYGSSGACQVKPIPLTEELLRKCGFQQRPIRNDSYSLFLQEFCIYRNEDTCHFELPNEYGGTGSYIEIKYLHQLQNLYFSLTGEELTITL